MLTQNKTFKIFAKLGIIMSICKDEQELILNIYVNVPETKNRCKNQNFFSVQKGMGSISPQEFGYIFKHDFKTD